ncbi:hypothetical protein ASC71_21125 [Rhizobium sp. Root1240]|nr:hypothetical protein ASC71_21125 [Rhizobium sp. Root1240]
MVNFGTCSLALGRGRCPQDAATSQKQRATRSGLDISGSSGKHELLLWIRVETRSDQPDPPTAKVSDEMTFLCCSRTRIRTPEYVDRFRAEATYLP